MRVGLCQINPIVGDFDANRLLIERAVADVRAAGAELAVLPELAVCGYPSEDLLLRGAFLEANDASLHALEASLPVELPVLVGCLERNDGDGRPLYNAVALIAGGRARIVARKCLLPTYDVFDEERFFESWQEPRRNVFEVDGTTIGVTICEDAWNDAEFFSVRRYHIDPVAEVVRGGAELVVNLSASPWGRQCGQSRGKHEFRAEMLAAASRRHGRRIVFVNQVGGNVGVQFDGGSTGFSPDGLAAAPLFFCSANSVVDTAEPWIEELPKIDLRAMQHDALSQGIRDYAVKFGFERVVVGLSGGIDSALTATLAADAIGPEHVAGIAMPSRYSSEHSVEDAKALARNLGIHCHEIPIRELQAAYEAALRDVFVGTEPGVAEENLQARARGAILMAYSNKFGALLMTTGNKSEAAVGYCTLYGDMCGALAPIADLWKTEVWELSRWINRDEERIPQRSIDKPPSAELRQDQLDTDTLPPYEQLDPVLRLLVEEERSVAETAGCTGMARERVAEMFRLVQRSEFKRVQYAPTIRVSERCWDGRRLPASHRYLES